MCRKDREVTDFSRMVEILQSCDCCRLGLVDENEAYIVPMNFGIAQEDGNLVLYFHTAKEGRKIELIKKQSVVAFQADAGHSLKVGESAGAFSYYYQCVMGKGRVALLSDNAEKVTGLKTIMAHYAGTPDWDFDIPCMDRIYVIKLTVTDWSCKVH